MLRAGPPVIDIWHPLCRRTYCLLAGIEPRVAKTGKPEFSGWVPAVCFPECSVRTRKIPVSSTVELYGQQVSMDTPFPSTGQLYLWIKKTGRATRILRQFRPQFDRESVLLGRCADGIDLAPCTWENQDRRQDGFS